MNLKLVVAISMSTAMPAFAQAPMDRPDANATQPTRADVQRVIQTISGDKTKMAAYCDLSKLNQQIAQTDGKRDTRALQIFGQKANDLTQKLGPDYVKLMDGLDQAEDNSSEGKDVAASFDEIVAALASLDKRCK